MSIMLLNYRLINGSTVDPAPLMGHLLFKDVVQCHIRDNTVAAVISLSYKNKGRFSV